MVAGYVVIKCYIEGQDCAGGKEADDVSSVIAYREIEVTAVDVVFKICEFNGSVRLVSGNFFYDFALERAGVYVFA